MQQLTQTRHGERDIATRRDIEVLVRAFYVEVRGDALLGELFARQIGSEWASHEARVCDFWETVLLGACKFKSRALLRHLEVDEACPLCPFHFQRWCDLFEKVVQSHFEGQCAERAVSRALAMSAALQNQLARENGCPLASISSRQTPWENFSTARSRA